MKLPKDREFLNLIVSGIAVLTGLAWMFLGNQLIALLVNGQNQAILYYFFSGIVLSISFIGIYGFIRTVLCFTEFMIEDDKLSTIMYENILNEEKQGVFLKNKNGIYKIISPVASQVLNLENKQVTGSTDRDLYKFSTASKITHEDRRVLEFNEIIKWETTNKTTNTDNNYLCKKIPCRNNKGEVIGILGICKNITDLRALQNNNQQLEERYNNLFNKLPYPVLVLDPISFQPYTFNNAMNKLLGYEKDEFSQMRLSLHVEPVDLIAFQHSIVDILNSRGGEFETRLVTKKRNVLNVAGYAQEIIIEDKTYLHILLYDNTEKKKSTDILIGSELKYRSLFEHANDAIIVVSPNSLNIIDANEIAIVFLGYVREDLFLMSITDLDASADHSLTQSKIADLEIYNHALYENIIQDRQGNKLQVDVNAHKLNYGNEDVYQFVIRNISSRKKTEAALKSSERRYRQMFQSNMAIKLVIDPEKFCIEDANLAASEFYGYSIDELKGMNLSQLNILSQDKLNLLIQQTREQNLGFYSCPHRLSDGEIRFVEVRDGPMEIDGRELIYSIIYDVTASKEAENQVLIASKMFDYSTDAVILINDKNQVVSVNHAFSIITGYQQSEIINAEPEIILSSPDSILIDDDVHRSIDENGQWSGEIWHRLKNGQSRPLKASINSIYNENTKTASYVVMLSPKYSHVHDQDNNVHFVELTQLPNRSLFLDRLQNALDRAQRNKSRLGVILVDFKKFSKINSRYGFDLGDQLLQSIAKRLKYNTRDSDTISHFNSDDFAILIEDLDNIQQMGIVAQKLLSTLSEIYQTTNHSIELDVSMGISIYPDDSNIADELMARAQTALSIAQKHPGNHFELSGEKMNRTANMWLKLETNLHTALRDNQFYISYMPQINLHDNTLSSLEALVRWKHPEHGRLLAEQFLPDAELTGFIGAIGFFIVEQSFQQYRHLLDLKLPIPRLHLNINQSQINSELTDILFEKCGQYNIEHSSVSLELSENIFVNLNPQQKNIINQLQSCGFSICIDGFCSTDSSFNALLQCTVNAVKLDPQLIQQAQKNREAEKLLQGLISFCNTLEIEIIAECIEDTATRDYLLSVNIKQMQGYLFSEPLAPNEIEDFIKPYI